ncbi:MAG TPA: cupin domain-containing protein [Stellaceae bacterium]
MNLLRDLPDARGDEVLDTILAAPGVRIERIVSHGQASPRGFWYDQREAEWVLLLAGAARLRFEDEPGSRLLGPGDCVHIAAHRRHRVDWTDPDRPTVWLAVFHPEAEADQNRAFANSASRNPRST